MRINSVVIGVAALVALAPAIALGASFRASDAITVGPQEVVHGDLYISGGTVSVGAPVAGDLVVFGGTIAVTGRVSGDLAAAGGNIQVLGQIVDDVRIGGGNLTFGDRIGGDLLAAGGTVTILPGAVVDGDLYVAGGQVIIDGTVRGSVSMTGGRLSINGTVLGSVDARSADAPVIGAGARIVGEVVHHPVDRPMHRGDGTAGGVLSAIFFAIAATVTAVKMLAYLGAAALVVWLWRRPATAFLQEAYGSWWRSVGVGVVYVILVPLASVLLLVSMIGLFPGVLLGLGYAGALVAANVLGGILLGSLVTMLFARRTTLQVTWASALGGVILFRLVTLIPFLGWLGTTLLFLAAFGVIADRFRKMIM